MIKLNHLIKEHLIYEGLIHSVSKTKFEDFVNRWATANDKIEVNYAKAGEKIVVKFIRKLNAEELDNLLKLINNLGWYVSGYLTGYRWEKYNKSDFVNDFNSDNKHENVIAIQVEAKFDLEVTDEEFEFLYHITPSINDTKIQKIGLVPKSLNKLMYHPERIYFARTEDDLKIIADKFNYLDKNLKSFSIYKVDIRSAKHNNEQLRLFDDPNFPSGIYTLSNIHSQDIQLIKKIIIG